MPDRDLALDSLSFEELTERFSAELTKRTGEAATTGELAIVWDTVRAQDAFIVEMSKRLDALEQRPAMRFVGTYSETKVYEPGDVCNRSGGLWECRARTTGAFYHGSWKLIVKGGAR